MKCWQFLRDSPHFETECFVSCQLVKSRNLDRMYCSKLEQSIQYKVQEADVKV